MSNMNLNLVLSMVREYWKNPNCWPELWIRNEDELTVEEKKKFVSIINGSYSGISINQVSELLYETQYAEDDISLQMTPVLKRFEQESNEGFFSFGRRLLTYLQKGNTINYIAWKELSYTVPIKGKKFIKMQDRIIVEVTIGDVERTCKELYSTFPHEWQKIVSENPDQSTYSLFTQILVCGQQITG